MYSDGFRLHSEYFSSYSEFFFHEGIKYAARYAQLRIKSLFFNLHDVMKTAELKFHEAFCASCRILGMTTEK